MKQKPHVLLGILLASICVVQPRPSSPLKKLPPPLRDMI